jgi:hypothetical protein
MRGTGEGETRKEDRELKRGIHYIEGSKELGGGGLGVQ